MSGGQLQFNGDPEVLHQNAVRTPLPDAEAERMFHESMLAVADARERKADLLEDPDTPVLTSYEAEFDRVAERFKRRLQQIAGDDYETVAREYQRGERDDRRGALSSYYLEGLWRIQQRTTVSDMLFFPLILRYPDSFTVNLRFASSHYTTASVRYESAELASIEPDDEYAELFREECRHEQKRAAVYLRDTAQIIREEFPDPDRVPFSERKFGGIVSAGGRRGSEFSVMLERVEPDPNRFAEPVEAPTLVTEGTEARQTESKYLPESAVVL